MTDAGLAGAVSSFGAAVKAKLGAAAVSGAPEDQLRAPLEQFVVDIGAIIVPTVPIVPVGETANAGNGTRPNYAMRTVARSSAPGQQLRVLARSGRQRSQDARQAKDVAEDEDRLKAWTLMAIVVLVRRQMIWDTRG